MGKTTSHGSSWTRNFREEPDAGLYAFEATTRKLISKLTKGQKKHVSSDAMVVSRYNGESFCDDFIASVTLLAT